MTIELRNYADDQFFCELPDTTNEICVIELSGDQVLVYPEYFDTGWDTRFHDIYDGSTIYKVAELEKVCESGNEFLRIPNDL